MPTITNQTWDKPEQMILDWLKVNKYFFNSQKVLAQAIGYSRWTTNHAIKSLEKKGLVVLKQSRSLNKKKKLIELSKDSND